MASKSKLNLNTKLPDGLLIITGATGLLGLAIAKQLAISGNPLLLVCHKNEQKALELKQSCLNLGACEVMLLTADLSTDGGLDSVTEMVQKSNLPVAGLVHLAGINERCTLQNLTRKKIGNSFDLDLTAPLLLIKNLESLMQKSTSIVLAGSRAAYAGLSETCLYSAAKMSLLGAVKPLTTELGAKGIRINVLEAGILRNVPDAEIVPMTDMIPLKRIGKPHEYASVVYFLLSAQSSYITGQSIAVSGGL